MLGWANLDSEVWAQPNEAHRTGVFANVPTPTSSARCRCSCRCSQTGSPTMKRASSPIHRLTAASDATTFVMASRPTYRGRGRGRGSSARPYSGGRGQFVSGDAHFRSVRDANLGFRQVDSGSFPNQTRYQNPPFNPRPPPPYHQNPQFRHPHPFNQPHRFRPPPSFDQKPAICPRQHYRPRPPDYRDWEYATTPPDPDCERFVVLSYNILADYLAIDHRGKLYYHIPLYMLDWQWRKRNLLFELGLWSADIMCLQEVDRFHDLEEEFKLKGYSGIWKMRTGNPVDGCSIFWRTSRFKLLHEECIEFNKLGLRDNVAQICVLELINQKGALPSSLTGSCKVVVCNIHVLYNPNRGEIKLGQVRVLLERAKAVSKSWNDAPVVICGDFNCTPKSPLYNFISEQKLYLSGVERNKVSGQASAVIGPPRQYRPNPSEMPAHGSVKGSSIVGDKEVNIEPSNCLSDMLNRSNQENNTDNQQTGIVLDVMSDKSLTNEQHGKDTHLNAVDYAKNLGEVDSLKEDSHASDSEGRFPVEHTSDEIHDNTPIASSAPEVVHTNAIGMGCAEQVSDAVPPSTHKILNETSNLYVPNENESMKFDSSPTSLQEDNQSSRIKIASESTGPLSLETSLTESSSQNSLSNVIEVAHPGNGESLLCELLANDQVNSSSTSYQVDESPQLANVDFPLDEKLQNLPLDEIDKTMIGCENIEDADDFISALHNGEEGFSQGLENSDQFELESASFNTPLQQQSDEMEDDLPPIRNTIDVGRSLWTPMEIETATGNAECTVLEHQLPLRSTYTEVTDCSGTRDSNGEPLVTSYNRCFSGTVDYIWRSEGLQTIRVLAPIPKHAMEWTPGFPTKKWGSDHIALVSELAFLKDVTHGRDVQ
ncbi:hypothetical protein L6164_024280 [Bauhinia variegata]|uniref:Uncharacterized protein n=1 Tax=Bauhinia variegata TaxID=167791 RepID=A0ACB9LX72_BAUVA|nr:hypothetical protein L6164_024280 [Bauhinia variegata]